MSSRSRKARPKNKSDLFGGKRDPATSLLRAVRRFVMWKGGTVLVIGGIQVQEWPGEGKFKYRIAVQCMGKRPAKELERV